MVTHLDRSRQSEYLHNTSHLTERMLATIWLVLVRLLWFAKRNGTIDGDTAVAANAKTSRRAEILGTRDGGCQGWLRQIKERRFKCCQDRDSILAAEKHLEALGIVEFEREGHGKVAIAHINLRAAALFLELFHPDFDELERVAPGLFRWVKPFCDEILGREFNRKGEGYETITDRYRDRDLSQFDILFPLRRFDFSTLPEHLVAMFDRFCRRTRDYYARTVIYWDVDISNPPDEWEYG
jgi:hypothetical protein